MSQTPQNPLNLALAVVTHESKPWLDAFFATWQSAVAQAQIAPPPVYVADSGSRDDTRETAARLCPAASVITCGNIGYGAAANRAINRSTEDWILLCNPDVTFPADFLTGLAQVLAHPIGQAGAYAPRLLNPDGSAQPSVGQWPTLLRVLMDQRRKRPDRKYVRTPPQTTAPIDWAMGACLLLHRERVRSVGGFDERFFLYVEEVDLLRRLAKQGYPTIYVPDLALTHHRPNASRDVQPEVQRYAARGQLRYFAKHGSWLGLRAFGLLGALAGRLRLGEALALRQTILKRPTGP